MRCPCNPGVALWQGTAPCAPAAAAPRAPVAVFAASPRQPGSDGGSSSWTGSLAALFLCGGFVTAARRRRAQRDTSLLPRHVHGGRSSDFFNRSTGIDDKKRYFFRDWRRREAKRRGEMDHLHDIDNFELTNHNLTPAPGSHTRKRRYGRAKYGHRGRSRGMGFGGPSSRGRAVIPRGWESQNVPIKKWVPKLDEEQLESMRAPKYTCLPIKYLNLCQDGDEVDYQDMFLKGHYPWPYVSKRFPRILVQAKEEDEFNVNNLTVYAHAFDPPARDKIESLGGKCIRLHDILNIPIESEMLKMLSPEEEEEGETEGETEEVGADGGDSEASEA